MPSEKKSFDFWYAVHNTQIVHVPSRALETFGETRIHYYHLAELPDVPGKVRVREGRLEAHKPLLITPEAYVQEEMSGFGEQAASRRRRSASRSSPTRSPPWRSAWWRR